MKILFPYLPALFQTNFTILKVFTKALPTEIKLSKCRPSKREKPGKKCNAGKIREAFRFLDSFGSFWLDSVHKPTTLLASNGVFAKFYRDEWVEQKQKMISRQTLIWQ